MSVPSSDPIGYVFFSPLVAPWVLLANGHGSRRPQPTWVVLWFEMVIIAPALPPRSSSAGYSPIVIPASEGHKDDDEVTEGKSSQADRSQVWRLRPPSWVGNRTSRGLRYL